MRIGLFTDTYFPQINGVATSTRILAAELRKKGHKVYVFTTTDPNAKAPEFDVFRLPSVAFVFLKSHRASIMFTPKALALVKKMDLDIVHTQTEFSLGVFGKIAAIRLKIPHVHSFHTMYPDYVHYIANGHLVTPKMAERFCRLCCNVAKTVIAPTQKVREFLVSVGVKRPIAIIPTGMEFEAFKRENLSIEEIQGLKRELGIEEGAPVIVTVGRIAKEKSVDVLIAGMPEILKAIPKATLVIVGDGPVKKQLEAMAKGLRIEENVIFTGAKPWADIGKYYAIGDVFANASVSEAQGLTFIEAMAAKTMVVAKNDPCLDGIVIHNETGLLFEKNEDFSRVIIEVLGDAAMREKSVERAYEHIQKFSAEKFAESVLAVYEETLSEVKPKEKRQPMVIKSVVYIGERLRKKKD